MMSPKKLRCERADTTEASNRKEKKNRRPIQETKGRGRINRCFELVHATCPQCNNGCIDRIDTNVGHGGLQQIKHPRTDKINKRLQHRMYHQQSKQATEWGGLLPSIQACRSSMFADRIEHRALVCGKNLPKQPLQYMPQKSRCLVLQTCICSCLVTTTKKKKKEGKKNV